MKIKHLIAVIALQITLTLSAKSVTSVPGGLSGILGADRDITALTVDGAIDASDIRFIADSLLSLVSLDLSRADIAPYNGAKLFGNIHTTPANVLPDYSLAGIAASTVILPSSLREIGQGALAASAIESIAIPAGVEKIGAGAFNGCDRLAGVTIQAAIIAIEPMTFKGCSSLQAISLPSSVTAIGAEAFSHCSALESVEIPASVTHIGARAFACCGALASLDIPASIRSIDSEAFLSTALRSVNLADNKELKSIGHYAFAHCGALADVTLPAGLVALPEGLFFGCTVLESVTLSPLTDALPPFILKGTSLAEADGVLTPSITKIGAYALHGNSRLSAMTLPAGLDSIGDRAMVGLEALGSIDASALKAVPALGHDVFEGTASPEVILLASDDLAPVFKATSQWQDFDIRTLGELGSAPGPVVDTPLSVRCDGSTLYLRSGIPFVAVSIYRINGHLVSGHTFSSASTSAALGAPEAGSVVLLHVIFEPSGTPASSSSTTLKLKL